MLPSLFRCAKQKLELETQAECRILTFTFFELLGRHAYGPPCFKCYTRPNCNILNLRLKITIKNPPPKKCAINITLPILTLLPTAYFFPLGATGGVWNPPPPHWVLELKEVDLTTQPQLCLNLGLD